MASGADAQSPGGRTWACRAPGAGQEPPPLAAGLSSEQAAARLAVDGANVLPAPRAVALWRRIAAQLRDPMILVLLAAAALTLATGDWTDASVIGLVIVVNTSVGVGQEVRADRAIAALSRLTAPEARVLRDGGQRQVPAAEVVVGDVLILAEGDIVPADAMVTEAAALLIDESALTGESVPVSKQAAPRAAPAGPGGGRRPEGQAGPAGQPEATVAAGTVVVRGRGRAVVTATGPASAMGRIAALMTARPALTPLQRRMAGLGRVLAVAAVVLCAIVMAVGLARGQPLELMIITAISLVVAAVPESLPAVVTLALALGARRMTARRAVVRRLPAVETLGAVTVIGTDKTGTLTEGNMVVRRLWTPGDVVSLSGAAAARPPSAAITELVTAGALCNDAALRRRAGGEDGWQAIGDPTEAALLSAAFTLGQRPERLSADLPRVGEIPFDSERQRMTTAHRTPAGGVRVICKGAPEAVLRPGVIAGGEAVIGRARAAAEDLAGAGLRVLAVAAADHPPGSEVAAAFAAAPAGGGTRGTGPGEPAPAGGGGGGGGGAPPRLDATVLEQGLRLLGLVGIADPPRGSAAATIAACKAAGITPVLITGDHPATARSIATELGIIEPGDEVVDCHGDGGGGNPMARVFARASPQRKLAIIEARQAAGDVVAMTGDGVNDAPALRRADIGVAMGGRGTEVARQAADLVLADDNLATVVAAAREGRRVYANIRRFLLYGLSGGAAEIAVMLAGPAFGLALPLLPAQILWVNLLTHGLPGVALGGEPADPDLMARPPRPPEQSILGAGLWQRIVRVGLVVTAVTLGVALWGHATGRPWQSMAFFALGTTQLAVALGSRARPGTLANPLLPASVLAALALQLAGLYLPLLRELLHTRPLSALDLLVVFALSTLGYAAIRLDRLVVRDDPAGAAQGAGAAGGSGRQGRS